MVGMKQTHNLLRKNFALENLTGTIPEANIVSDAEVSVTLLDVLFTFCR